MMQERHGASLHHEHELAQALCNRKVWSAYNQPT